MSFLQDRDAPALLDAGQNAFLARSGSVLGRAFGATFLRHAAVFDLASVSLVLLKRDVVLVNRVSSERMRSVLSFDTHAK
eukprot:CAMPEP_0183390268 /NCGR_PEP_ID=MMETSP0370-20130417/5556_1 /TAXON_ID=268820 /ORGANISM="Peridinium aciculiferum, Strain PAER-2" /LENGTH=79 /DNA_ID=CAMNT_0025569725 /DNA_START=187 /DNA_END=423 /DNA_ORIENTATION=-